MSHPAQQILYPVFLQVWLIDPGAHSKQHLARARFKSSATDRPRSEVWLGEPVWAGPRGGDVSTMATEKPGAKHLPHAQNSDDFDVCAVP